MPEPIHPPYNIVTPRQLDRWLDINAQNGALTRTRGFVSVPLNLAGNLQSTNSFISLFNNTVDFITFDLIDIDGNILETHQVNGGDTQVYTLIANCYAMVRRNSSSTIFPYIGWTGTITYDHSWSIETIPYPSDKILQFNYSASQNFSIVNDDNLKAFVAAYQSIFSVCIANIIKGTSGNPNTVVRYRLTKEEIENTNGIPYSGQKILGHYFQIEFWTLSNFAGIVLAPTVPYILNTSILSKTLDYRYGVDFAIHVAAPTIVTNFQNNNPDIVDTFNIPLIFNNNTVSGVN